MNTTPPKPCKKPKRKTDRQKQVRRMDDKFAVLIKLRDRLICQRCGSQAFITDNGKIPQGLDNSHWIGRKYYNTRWHYMNCHTNCVGCHFHFHQNPREYENWMYDKYGQGAVDLLRLKSKQIFKDDLTFIELWIDGELKKHLTMYPRLNYDFLKPIYRGYIK